MYPATAPPASYLRPYVGHGRSFNYSNPRGGYSRRGDGRGRGQGRSTPNVTNTNTNAGNSKPNEGQSTLKVSQTPDSKKSEPIKDNSRKNKRNFRGRGQGNRKQ